jgi:RNA polymerase sigma-70 factor (ECF subfamily)
MALGVDDIDRILAEWQTGIDREENFRRLFDVYYRPVYRFFEKRNFSQDECHDLTQETFIRVYKGVEAFRRDARFETWLFTIAANTFQKALRHQTALKRASQNVSLQDVAESDSSVDTAGQIAPATTHGPLDAVLDRERRRLLNEAVAELPEQMRKCMLLRVEQELSYQEIAAVLCLSVETVKAHLFQARQRLKVKLADYFSGPDG